MAQKTWSIVADKVGAHWHTTVRRGTEGSRAKLGELIFDLSDVEDFKTRVEYAVGCAVIRASSLLIQTLAKDNFFRSLPSPALMAMYHGKMLPECQQVAIEQLVHTFGARIDLAKVTG